MIRAFLAALLVVACAAASAQERVVTILVGAAPGSPADAIARIVAESMKTTLRVKVAVDNRPGAGGRAAAEALRAAPADGMTMMIASETLILAFPAEGQDLGYNPFRDFVPVSQAATSPFVLAVGGKSPAKSAAEFLKWAAAHPDKAEFATASTGSTPQFFGLALGESAGAKLRHIPYEAPEALLADLASGKIVAAVDTLANLAAQHRAGKVRVLAVSGAKRSPLLPKVPTFAEEGLKDPGGEGWLGFFAPWNSPKASVERLAGGVRAALQEKDARDRIAKLGLEVTGTQSYELRALAQSEYARWSAAARAAGLTSLEVPYRLIH
jgi:tripartite-type tricarboxylate transporter receptor subunit TctC